MARLFVNFFRIKKQNDECTEFSPKNREKKEEKISLNSFPFSFFLFFFFSVDLVLAVRHVQHALEHGEHALKVRALPEHLAAPRAHVEVRDSG